MGYIKTDSEKFKEAISGIVGLVVIIGAIYFGCNGCDSKPKEKTRKQRIEEQFSLDGSHKKLREEIKSQLKDPDSYKNVNTVYWDRDSFIMVKTEYTATNSFGGRVKNIILAKCDTLEGDILEILSSTNQ